MHKLKWNRDIGLFISVSSTYSEFYLTTKMTFFYQSQFKIHRMAGVNSLKRLSITRPIKVEFRVNWSKANEKASKKETSQPDNLLELHLWILRSFHAYKIKFVLLFLLSPLTIGHLFKILIHLILSSKKFGKYHREIIRVRFVVKIVLSQTIFALKPL